MKKIIVCLMLLCMVTGSAFAELTRVDAEMAILENDWSGEYHILDDVPVRFWVPDGLTERQVSNADYNNGIYARFASDFGASITVYSFSVSATDADDVVALLWEKGCQSVEEERINGLSGVYYERDGGVGFMFPIQKGIVMSVEYSPVSDESSRTAGECVLASIEYLKE